MSTFITPAIPADQLVDIVSSVLAAGGNGLDLITIGLTQSTEIPIGQVVQFADATDVGNTFGPTSPQAGLATVYFNGPNNATKTPGSMLWAQYPKSAVSGWMRSGSMSGMTVSQLQTIDASLTLTIDGTPVTQTVNLLSATSFSNAAVLIASQMGIQGAQKASITGSLSGNTMTVTALGYGPQQCSFTASLNGTTMTVTAVASGQLALGQVVVGTGLTAGTTISAFGTGDGGIGTYTLSAAATTESAESIVAYSPIVTLSVGDVLSGTGLTAGTYISAFGTGTGGLGTYTLSTAPTSESAETITVYGSAVQYDAVQQRFVFYSATTGVNSSVGYGGGAAATSLLLTQALGAILSPGAAATNPATFMPTITGITQNWVSFFTDWEPITEDKEGFETWTNGTKNRYVYLMWDTNALNTGSSGPSPAVGYLPANALSGTFPIYQSNATTLGGEKAAFTAGWMASLDTSRLNGRATIAFKAQSGLAPDVTNGTVAINLCGSPSTASFGYGVNFYGDYTTANQAFYGMQRGVISGPFVWLDSYVNQIILTNALQLAIMTGLASVNSAPYNQAGYTTIESWCLDPISQMVNFGAIVAGVSLSAAQANAVNAAAGLTISTTLTQRGWYLQVGPAPASARVGRVSPPATLWYCDGGSIQNISLAAIEIQ